MAKKFSLSLLLTTWVCVMIFIFMRPMAGIALTGTEIKSIRQGKLNLKDSFWSYRQKGTLVVWRPHRPI